MFDTGIRVDGVLVLDQQIKFQSMWVWAELGGAEKRIGASSWKSGERGSGAMSRRVRNDEAAEHAEQRRLHRCTDRERNGVRAESAAQNTLQPDSSLIS